MIHAASLSAVKSQPFELTSKTESFQLCTSFPHIFTGARDDPRREQEERERDVSQKINFFR